jgi:hypothetical protein
MRERQPAEFHRVRPARSHVPQKKAAVGPQQPETLFTQRLTRVWMLTGRMKAPNLNCRDLLVTASPARRTCAAMSAIHVGPTWMSSQPNSVVRMRSPGRSSTDVVADSITAGPSIIWPDASASNA